MYSNNSNNANNSNESKKPKINPQVAYHDLMATLVKKGMVPIECYKNDGDPADYIVSRLSVLDQKELETIYMGFVDRLQKLGEDVKYEYKDGAPSITYPDASESKSFEESMSLAAYYSKKWRFSLLYAQLRIAEAGDIDWKSPPSYLESFITRIKKYQAENTLKDTNIVSTYRVFLFTDVQREMKDVPFGCSTFTNPITGKALTEIIPRSTHVVEVTPKGLVCWDLIGMAVYFCCSIYKGSVPMMPSSNIQCNLLTFGLVGFALKGLLATNADNLVVNLQKMYLKDIASIYDTKLAQLMAQMFQDPETVFVQLMEQVPKWKQFIQDKQPLKSLLDPKMYTNTIIFHVENIRRILADSFKKFQIKSELAQRFKPNTIDYWIQVAQSVTIPSHIDYSPDATKIERLLASASTEEEKQEYQWLVDNIKYVSFKDLLSYLQVAVIKFLKSISMEGKQEHWAAVILSDKNDSSVEYVRDKSNVWILRLILKFIPEIMNNLPKKVIYKLSQVASSDIPQNLVFFDDIIYTGFQMEGIVERVDRRCKRKTYHAIVACASDEVNVGKRFFQNKFLHKGCTIEEIEVFGREAFPVYTQYKLPDNVSCFDKLIAKIIKNCDSPGGKRMNQCPIVPYKEPNGWGPDVEDDEDMIPYQKTVQMDFELLE